jgi:NADH dehydrogenase [ubiquinone] 1 alpha subcomplex assembly factor 7
VTQGDFLARLGLGARAARLAAARPDRADVIRGEAARLSAPAQMGRLFKVICVAHPACAEPPGFSA